MSTEAKPQDASATRVQPLAGKIVSIGQPRGGMSGVVQATELVELVRTGTVSAIDAKELIVQIIDTVATAQSLKFAFSSDLEPTSPGCGPSFSRSFQHVDWIDGESVVQAEQSSGEDGFNRRFHRIESDFDALSVDVDKAFDCLAALRAKAAKLLGEVESEFNHVHQLIAQKTTPSTDAQTLDGKDSSEFALVGHTHDGRYLQLTHQENLLYTPSQTRLLWTLPEPPDHVAIAYNVAATGDLPSNRTFVRGPRSNDINVWVDKSGSGDDKEYKVSVQNTSTSRLWIRVSLFFE